MAKNERVQMAVRDVVHHLADGPPIRAVGRVQAILPPVRHKIPDLSGQGLQGVDPLPDFRYADHGRRGKAPDGIFKAFEVGRCHRDRIGNVTRLKLIQL